MTRPLMGDPNAIELTDKMDGDERSGAETVKELTQKRQGKVRPQGAPDNIIPDHIANENVNSQRSYHGRPDKPSNDEPLFSRSFLRCVHQNASMSEVWLVDKRND
ncbi:MAG: hypothetical protein KKE00_00430 [Proteobacteria bacterium]|nr:hypothetical protein [Pseudomonadota bacterium]